MPSKLRFGPWPEGLNLRDGTVAADQVGPAQLRGLLNLDVTDSGVLVPRRGVRRSGSTAMYAALGAGGSFEILGAWEFYGSRHVVVGAWNPTSGNTSFYSSRAPASSLTADWPELSEFGTPASATVRTGRYTAMVPYNGTLYFVPKPSGGGTGFSKPDLAAGAPAAVAALPAGDSGFVVRDRMFVINEQTSRVYYSKATDPTVWAAPDGGSFDVSPDDGQFLAAAAVVNSQIYLFKRNATYLFTFSTDPGLDGQLTLLNDQLGAFDAVVHENGVLLVNDRGVYLLQNNYFSQRDQLVGVAELFGLPELNFGGGTSTGAPKLTLEQDQLVVGPSQAAGSAYSHLAMNLRTGAWSGRTYADSKVAPSTRSATARDPNVSTAILYGDGTNVLSATVTAPRAGRANQTLDYTSALAVVSPAYGLLTGEWDGEDPTAHKGGRWVSVRLRRALAAGDAVLSLLRHSTGSDGPDMDIAGTDQTVPLAGNTWGGKVAGLTQFRFATVALELAKAQTTVSPTVSDPATASDLWVRALWLELETAGGSLRT